MRHQARDVLSRRKRLKTGPGEFWTIKWNIKIIEMLNLKLDAFKVILRSIRFRQE